jgi:hypothetical protein
MLLLSFFLVAAVATNMNGGYQVASVDNLNATWNSDFASKGHEYFDLWAPEIATHYGEVFWTNQGKLDLPEEIIKRFEGKVLAITGYEQDQVMVNPVGKPGVNPEQDVSVPINWAYNHHYGFHLLGKHAELKEITITDENELWENHGHNKKWIAADKTAADGSSLPRNFKGVAPTSQDFAEGNGGESRKSFHGYPAGFAQLLESPTSWTMTPMQIDTRNRDCGVTPESVTNCSTQFTPGPEPRQARYGRGWAGVHGKRMPGSTNYSGILECPCNSRFGGDPIFYPEAKTKLVTHKYSGVSVGSCTSATAISSREECFSAVPELGFSASKVWVNNSISDPAQPVGCSVTAFDNETTVATFNSAGTTGCSDAVSPHHTADAKAANGVRFSVALTNGGEPTMQHKPKGVFCSNHVALQAFVAASLNTSDLQAALSACDSYCLSTSTCNACSVDVYGTKEVRWNALASCGTVKTWAGAAVGDISTKTSSGNATITLTGPADVWFAVGLDAKLMTDKPYTLIVNASGVIEQQIGTCGSEADHCAGTRLKSSVTVTSNAVEGGVRTVVMTRPYQGATAEHYTFDPTSVTTINFIAAVGSSPLFAYHKAHALSVLTFTTPNRPLCVCDVGAVGQLCESNGTSCSSFLKNCDPAPAGSLRAQNNPTCNSRQYAGGLRCCTHKRIMLDADQAQVESLDRELLRYHMKIRIWFQEYTPASTASAAGAASAASASSVSVNAADANPASGASHQDLPRIYYQTEQHAGEYDIPPAFARPNETLVGYNGWPEGTPTPGTTCTGTCPDGKDCKCEHTIVARFSTGRSPMRLVYAGGHCHAPACIGIWLYRNDTGHDGELLCHQAPVYGAGNVLHDKFDEAGYLSLPPCLWGDDEGLSPSVLMPANTPLYSIKKNTNTHLGHFGEMASWQMRGVSA